MLCADLGGCCVSWKNDTDVLSCSNIQIAPYRCYCDEDCWQTDSCCYDYEEFCEWDICKTDPCENDGTCVVDEDGIVGYRCLCAEEFTGTHCEVGCLYIYMCVVFVKITRT